MPALGYGEGVMRKIRFLSGSIWNTLMLLIIIFMLPGTAAAIAGTERSLQEAYRSEIARAEQVTEAGAESLKSQMKRAQDVLFYVLESSGELLRMRSARAVNTEFKLNSVKLAQSVKAMSRFSEGNYDGVFFTSRRRMST